ncbi:TraG-like protein, N-terminal region, partial [Desulfacinum hydrothermale DSM 13146]
MGPTIYVTTDGELVFEALKAVSSVFSSSSHIWSGAGLAGVGFAVGMGLLLTFAIQVLSGFLENRMMRFEPLILGFLIYAAMFVPKTSVNVEDISTGTVYVVNDVPIGIAYSGAFVSGITRRITEEIENGFVSAGLLQEHSVSSGGYLQPHLVFLAIRNAYEKGFETQKMFYQNLAYFMRNCVHGRKTFNAKYLNEISNPADYLFNSGNFNVGLSFEVVDMGNGLSTIGVSCGDQASYLSQKMQDFFYLPVYNGKSAFENMLHSDFNNSNGNVLQVMADGGWDWSDVQNAIHALLGSTLMDSYDFMNKLFIGKYASIAATCGAISGLNDYKDCIQKTVTETQMEEQIRSETTGQAAGFLKFMQPTMAAFQFLFFALSPLVAIVVAMAGAQSIRLLTNYFIFGVWTQSWTAVAAILNFMIITQTKNVLAGRFAGMNALSMENLVSVFDTVQNKLAVGNTLLAATPVITLAVLTGSTYALTQIAGRFGAIGGDKTDEKLLSPSYAATQAQVTATGKTQDIASVAPDIGGVAIPRSPILQQMAPFISASSVMNRASGVAQTLAQESQQQASRAINTAMERVSSLVQSVGKGSSVGSEHSSSLASAMHAVDSYLRNIGTQFTLTNADKAQLATLLAMRSSLGLGLNALASIGAGMEWSASGRKAMEKALQYAFSMSGKSQFSEADEKKWNDIQKIQQSMKNFWNESAERSKAYKSAEQAALRYSKLQKIADTASDTASLVSGITQGQKINLYDMASQMFGRYGEGKTGEMISSLQTFAQSAGADVGQRYMQRTQELSDYYGKLGYDPRSASYMAHVQALGELPGMASGEHKAEAVEAVGKGLRLLFRVGTEGTAGMAEMLRHSDSVEGSVQRGVSWGEQLGNRVDSNLASGSNAINSGWGHLANDYTNQLQGFAGTQEAMKREYGRGAAEIEEQNYNSQHAQEARKEIPTLLGFPTGSGSQGQNVTSGTTAGPGFGPKAVGNAFLNGPAYVPQKSHSWLPEKEKPVSLDAVNNPAVDMLVPHSNTVLLSDPSSLQSGTSASQMGGPAEGGSGSSGVSTPAGRIVGSGVPGGVSGQTDSGQIGVSTPESAGGQPVA